MDKFSAIVLSAGKGTRMNSDVHKQYLDLLGRPVLYYSLAQMQQHPAIREIILVVGAGEEDYVRTDIVDKYHLDKVRAIVPGGKERYHSVKNGLAALSEQDGFVLIHDGARPCVTKEIIDRCIDSLKQSGSAVAGMPVKDTIKVVDGESFVKDTPERKSLWLVQTPQCFPVRTVAEAYAKMEAEGFTGATDDAMLVERYFPDFRVKMVEGAYTNIKVTTPEDLPAAGMFLERR